MTPEERNAWAAYDGHRIDRAELKAVLVQAAMAEEREACAKVAESTRPCFEMPGDRFIYDGIAAAIRARA